MELVAAHPCGKNSQGIRVIEPDPQSLVHQLMINGGPASRRGGRITLLEPQRLRGLRADLRISEPGDIEASALSRRNAQQVNSGSMKSAGAAYRSTSRTTLPAPGHRIPRTLKYVSGLVFGTVVAAGHPAALIPADLIAAGPGWATARITPALILHSKNSGS